MSAATILVDDVIHAPRLAAVPSAADGRAATAWRGPSSAPRAIVVARTGAGLRAAARVTSAEDPGCYRGVTPWTARHTWLAGIQLYLRHYPEALATPSTRDVVSLETFMVVLAITVDYADEATGRSIRACKATVAAKAGCSPTTVQRVWRIADRRLGILRLIRRARPLTMAERFDVRHGPRMVDGKRCPQRGVTALRAAHTPRWLHSWVAIASIQIEHVPVEVSPYAAGSSVDIAPLPRRASPEYPSHLPTSSPCGRNAVSLRSTQRTRSARRHDRGGAGQDQPPKARKPRQKLAGERLAADLALRAPWAAGLSPRRTAAGLADYERAGWTAGDWLAAARDVLQTLKWTMPRDGIHSPGGFIRWLTTYMTPDNPSAIPIAAETLRCGRPECDHGWITPTDPLGLSLIAGPSARCTYCRPGAWPFDEHLVDELDQDEPPF